MPKSRTEFAAVSRPPTPRLALSIREFCRAHGISEGFFYKLKKQGEGPREMKVGARTLITLEVCGRMASRARMPPIELTAGDPNGLFQLTSTFSENETTGGSNAET